MPTTGQIEAPEHRYRQAYAKGASWAEQEDGRRPASQVGSLGTHPLEERRDVGNAVGDVGYTFIGLSPAVVTEAARLSNWNPERSPFMEVVNQLGKPDVFPRDSAQLGALLVREIFKEPLPVERCESVLFAVCERLQRRPVDAQAALEAFEQVLPRVFGLNVVGEQQAMKAYRVWQASPHRGLVLAR